MALAEDVSSLQDSAEYDSEDDAKAEAKAAYVEHLKTLAGGCTLPPDGTDTDVKFYTFALTYANDAVRIETKIKMKLEYEVKKIEKEESLPDGTTTKVIKYTAKVSKATHSYITYTITHLTAEKGGTSE